LPAHTNVVDAINSSPTAARDEAATNPMPYHANLHSSKTPCAQVDYIDAVDATDEIIYLKDLRMDHYMNLEIRPGLTKLPLLVDQTYVCCWPSEWTNIVNALKKDGDEQCNDIISNRIRMMNCKKMYDLGITPESFLFVRDHKSIGQPFIFWTHNLKRESKEEVVWKVAISNDGE